eukprot:366190-Chlamydomonas_euryale.AAC.1
MNRQCTCIVNRIPCRLVAGARASAGRHLGAPSQHARWTILSSPTRRKSMAIAQACGISGPTLSQSLWHSGALLCGIQMRVQMAPLERVGTPEARVSARAELVGRLQAEQAAAEVLLEELRQVRVVVGMGGAMRPLER